MFLYFLLFHRPKWNGFCQLAVGTNMLCCGRNTFVTSSSDHSKFIMWIVRTINQIASSFKDYEKCHTIRSHIIEHSSSVWHLVPILNFKCYHTLTENIQQFIHSLIHSNLKCSFDECACVGWKMNCIWFVCEEYSEYRCIEPFTMPNYSMVLYICMMHTTEHFGHFEWNERLLMNQQDI